MLAMFLSALDQTIVFQPACTQDNGNNSMPYRIFELVLRHICWPRLLTVPIYGKLSDIFGRRGLYILGIVIFLAGSALSGLSQNMTQLIIFRGLQASAAEHDG
jgi:MFS family permease